MAHGRLEGKAGRFARSITIARLTALGDLCAAAPPPRLRAMKIYTRTGDDGDTGLLGSGRLPKSAPRVEAYGAVDELNAMLGIVLTLDIDGALAADLALVQARLFQLGAELATTDAAMLQKLDRVSERDVTALESWIDRLDREIAPLATFILPGGTPVAAQLHLARTVCRRAERRVVALMRFEPVGPLLVRYLNRLADLLFVLARWCNARAGVAETPWRGKR
jgi:cob(I)alamin adenosyltransferase